MKIPITVSDRTREVLNRPATFIFFGIFIFFSFIVFLGIRYISFFFGTEFSIEVTEKIFPFIAVFAGFAGCFYHMYRTSIQFKQDSFFLMGGFGFFPHETPYEKIDHVIILDKIIASPNRLISIQKKTASREPSTNHRWFEIIRKSDLEYTPDALDKIANPGLIVNPNATISKRPDIKFYPCDAVMNTRIIREFQSRGIPVIDQHA